jgi:hypothetical protein
MSPKPGQFDFKALVIEMLRPRCKKKKEEGMKAMFENIFLNFDKTASFIRKKRD